MSAAEHSKTENKQLESLVLLRAIAVLMICFCHFGYALSTGHSLSGLFEMFNRYGKYGIHIFFVISGFIIPFSLLKGNYSILDYPRFLYKRFLRLHPPYLAALVFTLVVIYLSYKTRHFPFPENTTSILKSLVYFHVPADNPVFWTLIVEAQYYLFIGVFYTLLMQYTKIAYFIVIPTLLFLSKSIAQEYFFLQSYIVFFLIGNVASIIFTKRGSTTINFLMLLFLLLFTAFFYEPAALISSLFTVAIILLYNKPVHPILQFIGMISYSIYLVHFPIGIKLINFFKLKMDLSYSWLLFPVALLITIFASWIFYKVFEDISEKLSKKIKYKAADKSL